MTRWLALAVLACGCRQLWGLGTPDHAIEDAPIDAPPDVAIDAPTCFGTFGADAPYCFTTRPTDPLMLTIATTIDTDNDARCDTTRTGECVIAASELEVSAKVNAKGSRPLVMIATGSLTISALGSIDVASHRGGGGNNTIRGPAANDASCDHGQSPNGAGGGEGASFGGLGGNGGDSTGSGGHPGATMVPTTLRGGCQGTSGSNGGIGGAGGDGGGAVYLIAGELISVNGFVDASGAAGAGSVAAVRGGGGGGSGGLIVLESPTIEVGTGSVFANGGGGGGGGSATNGAGSNGDEATGVQAPSGGGGTSPAADGGSGSGIAMPTGTDGSNANGNGGGGGGGGGAGVIKTIGGSISNPLVVSPTPS